MAISYKWMIPSMEAYVEKDGEDNVIFRVQWCYVGEEDIYQAVETGMQDYTYTAGDPFVPYADTEAFEDVVIGWLEGSLDVPAMQADIDAKIAVEKNPVIEELYFTWNDI
jgi:hypothetical protein